MQKIDTDCDTRHDTRCLITFLLNAGRNWQGTGVETAVLTVFLPHPSVVVHRPSRSLSAVMAWFGRLVACLFKRSSERQAAPPSGHVHGGARPRACVRRFPPVPATGDRSAVGRTLLQRQRGACAVMVLGIAGGNALQITLTLDNHVVQAFSAY